MLDKELQSLDQRVDTLLGLCQRLSEENAALKRREEELLQERTGLIEKTELARVRVETMITRLQELEEQS